MRVLLLVKIQTHPHNCVSVDNANDDFGFLMRLISPMLIYIDPICCCIQTRIRRTDRKKEERTDG